MVAAHLHDNVVALVLLTILRPASAPSTSRRVVGAACATLVLQVRSALRASLAPQLLLARVQLSACEGAPSPAAAAAARFTSFSLRRAQELVRRRACQQTFTMHTLALTAPTAARR